ncbi:MAG: hypothetical protein OQK46_00810 [Gammaproteobacteria bacterium]|nr:hypothetical protein [Gammaproteobacteria bacterium]
MLSVLNISVQVPAHAAMKVKMQQSNMMQEISDCHCPPALCDSVLALDNQSNALVSIPSFNNRSTGLYEIIEANIDTLNQIQHVEQLLLNVSQASPPTLLIKTVLTI